MKNIATIKGYDFKNENEFLMKKGDLLKKGYILLKGDFKWDKDFKEYKDTNGVYTAYFIKSDLL